MLGDINNFLLAILNNPNFKISPEVAEAIYKILKEDSAKSSVKKASIKEEILDKYLDDILSQFLSTITIDDKCQIHLFEFHEKIDLRAALTKAVFFLFLFNGRRLTYEEICEDDLIAIYKITSGKDLEKVIETVRRITQPTKRSQKNSLNKHADTINDMIKKVVPRAVYTYYELKPNSRMLISKKYVVIEHPELKKIAESIDRRNRNNFKK